MNASYKIAVVPGNADGLSRMIQATRVLEHVAAQEKLGLELRWLSLPETTQPGDGDAEAAFTEEIAACHAALFGFVGFSGLASNSPNVHMREMLLTRGAFSPAINYRPIRLYRALLDNSALRADIAARGLDIAVVRDQDGGMMVNKGHIQKGEHGLETEDREYYNEEIIERTLRFAFQEAMRRRKKLTVLGKYYICSSSVLWKQVAERLAVDYPEVNTRFEMIDDAAKKLLRHPESYDVVATASMFGDIIADLVTAAAGSEMMQPSAMLSADGRGCYEPNAVHIERENGLFVNPVSCILAAAMMLRYTMGNSAAADRIEQAVYRVIERGTHMYDARTTEGRTVSPEVFTDEVMKQISSAWEAARAEKK